MAWEMWLRGDFLVPHLNGLPYSHKPPLLFWLIHAGWAVFGVNEWWPRVISPLSALIATWLTARLARELWPGDSGPARIVPWLLTGALGWMVFSQMLMFDMLLTVCVLVALTGVWRASRFQRAVDFGLVAAGVAAGTLSKGPVALVHILVPALFAPWWSAAARRRPVRWIALMLASTAAGLLAAGAWALPAAAAGGSDYAAAILWGQTAGRVHDSFAHARPWFGYAIFLPLMLLPWVLWPSLWRRARGAGLAEEGTRFALVWAGSGVIALSLLSAKQPHYILPEVAAVCLLFGRMATGRIRTPPIGLATATVAAVCVVATIVLALEGEGQDLRQPAQAIAGLQRAGAPVFVSGSYRGQVGFLGRLEHPLPVVPRGGTQRWAARHAGAYLVSFGEREPDGAELDSYARFPYRGSTMHVWRAPQSARPRTKS